MRWLAEPRPSALEPAGHRHARPRWRRRWRARGRRDRGRRMCPRVV